MMRLLFAALLVGHGVAHLVGFVMPWRLVASAEMPYRTTLLGGQLDVGDIGIRAVGILWLMLAMAFMWLGVALLINRWSQAAALVIVAVSLALCVVGWPDTRFGLVVNVLLLAMLLAKLP